MSSDRDRLIELVDKAKEEYAGDVTDHTETDYIVECLLNNGTILPPCKVGDKVWDLHQRYNGTFTIREGKISMITQKADKSWHLRITVNSSVWGFTPNEIGTRYFLTKEEAEAELQKERGGNVAENRNFM